TPDTPLSDVSSTTPNVANKIKRRNDNVRLPKKPCSTECINHVLLKSGLIRFCGGSFSCWRFGDRLDAIALDVGDKSALAIPDAEAICPCGVSFNRHTAFQ